jgi:hypothetical protein
MIYGTVAYTLKDGRKTAVSLTGLLALITEAEYMDRSTGPLEQSWRRREASGSWAFTRYIW